jgi:CDP-diacylglycerol pyrophosphatase
MAIAVNARRVAAVSAVLIALSWHLATAQAANPNALWDIVHGKCVPDELQHGDPWPCAKVDLARGAGGGFAILKDLSGATQYLLIPTKRVSGIESPALLAPYATNYFAEAWESRGFVAWALLHPMPRDTLSLAINSDVGRSQNQMHIHIDCIRADVRQALLGQRTAIGPRWAPLKILLAGHRYRAMRITGETLAGQNPFKLLARGVPGARADMGRHTLVVVGMLFAGEVPGFILLDDHADPAHGDWGSGEELQDHACALGH